MHHAETLKRFLDLFRRPVREDGPAFAGPTLLDQEPELAHEIARHAQA